MTYDADEELAVVDELPAEPVVTVSGSSGDLETWLWRRGTPDRITIEGDPDVAARFRAIVDRPIN